MAKPVAMDWEVAEAREDLVDLLAVGLKLTTLIVTTVMDIGRHTLTSGIILIQEVLMAQTVCLEEMAQLMQSMVPMAKMDRTNT